MIPKTLSEELKFPLNFVASLVTLGTFLLSMFYPLGRAIEMPFFPVDPIPLRIIILILMEAALALVFGWILIHLTTRGHGIAVPLVVSASLLSAWTSLFNIQWVLLRNSPQDSADHMILIAAGLVALVIAIYFIWWHWDTLKERGEIRRRYPRRWVYQREQESTKRKLVFTLRRLSLLQLATFGIMYGVIYLGPLWSQVRDLLNAP